MEKVIRYDRAKNKVLINFSDENDIKEGKDVVGHNVGRYTQEYDPAHIKNLYKNFNARIVGLEKQIKDAKLKLNVLVFKFDEDEIKKIIAIIEESKKLQEKDRLEGAIKFMEEQLTGIKSDKRDLEPVVKQLKK